MRARQRRLRHDCFVGRAAELATVERAVAGQSEVRVLFVHGAGGIGKTSLLLEIAERTPGALYLDAHDFDATPESLEAALAPTFRAGDEPAVILLDGGERLGMLDGWLRESLLPRLPDHVVLVIAGRTPPAPEWRALTGWGRLIRDIALAGLADDEARALLDRLCVPEARRDEMLSFTRGHPLALWLCADALGRAPEMPLAPPPVDVVQTLVRVFVSHIERADRRAALEAAAVVRVVSEPILRGLLGDEVDAHPLFDWLASLPIFEAAASGLVMHDLAREVLDADLRWRDAERWATLLQRAQTFYEARVKQVPRAEQPVLALEALFLIRHVPGFGDADWDAAASLRVELALPRDHAALARMVARYEGEESARIAERWMRSQPNAVYLYRDAQPEPAGLTMMLALEKANAEEIAADPGAAAAWASMERLGRLRPGESALMVRFGMDRDAYQSPFSPFFMRHFALVCKLIATTSGIRFTFGAISDPDAFAGFIAQTGAIREVDFHVGGHGYGLFRNDILVVTAHDLFRRVLPGGPSLPGALPAPTRLEKAAFAHAVRDALKGLHDATALAESPLCDSRLTWVRAGLESDGPARAAVLRTLIVEAVGALEGSPAGARTAPVLRLTFLEPAPVQKQAAASLGLAWGSYRRHLAEGVAQVVDLLWQREID